jgi:hypothetical protein
MYISNLGIIILIGFVVYLYKELYQERFKADSFSEREWIHLNRLLLKRGFNRGLTEYFDEVFFYFPPKKKDMIIIKTLAKNWGVTVTYQEYNGHKTISDITKTEIGRTMQNSFSVKETLFRDWENIASPEFFYTPEERKNAKRFMAEYSVPYEYMSKIKG